jgi:hypothetical protein
VGWRHRALASLACFWAIAVFLAIRSVLSSGWPPPGQAPTPDQIRAAGQAAWAVAAVATFPLAGGLLLACRWRMCEWAIAFGVFLLFAVLSSAMLLALADG